MLTTIRCFVALNHDCNAIRFAMMMAAALGCYCFCSEVCLRGFIELRNFGFLEFRIGTRGSQLRLE